MIIWQGLGYLGFLIPVVFYGAGFWLTDTWRGHGYSASHGWPGSIALLLSAVVVFLVAERLSAQGRTYIDPRTGQQLRLRRKDTLFWVPLRYVALLVVLVAVVLLVVPRT